MFCPNVVVPCTFPFLDAESSTRLLLPPSPSLFTPIVLQISDKMKEGDLSFKDQSLLAPDDLVKLVIDLALSCSDSTISRRPQMRDVVAELAAARSMHLGKSPDKHAAQVEKSESAWASLKHSLSFKIRQLESQFEESDSFIYESHSREL